MGPLLAGLAAPLAVYVLVMILHLAMPARHVVGYARHAVTGERLRYRLNGLAVVVAVVGLWWLAGDLDVVAWDELYRVRWTSAIGACLLGIAASGAVVAAGRPVRSGVGADFFFGRLENPQYLAGRVDAKMFLYLAGAAMLELNLLAFAAHHRLVHATDPSPGLVLHVVLFTWFVVDYLTFEHVHLYTYDLFAERVGFKLTWGCLAFYPFFYPIGLWAVADLPNPHSPPALLVVAAVVFVVGWVLARGANLQKYAFKRDRNRAFLGLFTQEAISDGEHHLLCSGFWSIARHVNYLGEILMALGLTLSLGHLDSPWPWLYPLYYLALLVPRERDDDRRCAAKYGALWDRYRERVPSRIVPGVW